MFSDRFPQISNISEEIHLGHCLVLSAAHPPNRKNPPSLEIRKFSLLQNTLHNKDNQYKFSITDRLSRFGYT